MLKGLTDIKERTLHLTQKTFNTNQLHIWDIYHFGGYAKKTDELIEFINNSWRQYQLPLDFVYTGKAFYALIDNIKKDYFMKGSNILFIHTGGLQGNLSLPEHTLLF
ncbi:MAG: hypothetical protein IPP48_13090 [Chitinophagaceae bacterium]|nr:hypothetical protein [Chitinophagaceae bacterium]